MDARLKIWWGRLFRWVCITILFFGYFYSLSQSISAIKNQYTSSLSNTVVLKNVNNRLPLQNLNFIHAGYLKANYNTLDFYSHINKYQLVPEVKLYSLQNKSLDKSINLVIVDIDLEKINHHDLIGLSSDLDRQITQYVVFIANVKPGLFPGNIFLNAAAIIVSTEYSKFNALHAAQIIYGAEAAIGTLPYRLNHEYTTQKGLTTQSLDRLKYGPPELVGISGNDFNYKLQLELEEAVRNDIFPGANLLVAKDGIVIYHEAFGKKRHEDKEALDKDQLYDLASITKIFAATLGSMKLHSEGKFDPDKTLSYYWRYLKKSNKANLVWKEVLAHRARLVASVTYYKKLLHSNNTYKKHSLSKKKNKEFSNQVTDSLFASKKIPAQLLKEIKRTALLPNQNYVYSDLSMILLGKTIEEITHTTLDKYLTSEIYHSLGADETTFRPLQKFAKNKTVPTEIDLTFRKDLVHGYVHDENAALLNGISGHAGLFSNANDMAKIAQMLLNKGSYGGKKYLNPESVELYTKYQFESLENRRGLGFDKPLLKYDINQAHTARDASRESYGHSGFTGTFVWMDPKYNLTYILLTNRVYPSRVNNKISQYSIRPCIQQTIYDYVLNASN